MILTALLVTWCKLFMFC